MKQQFEERMNHVILWLDLDKQFLKRVLVMNQ